LVGFLVTLVVCSLFLTITHMKAWVITCVRLLKVWIMPMPMPICVQLVVSSLVLKAEFVFNKFVLGFSSFFLQDYGVNSICELHEHLIPLFYCFFHVLMDRKVCYFHPYASNRLTTLCFLEKNQQTLMLVG
jgi:hypothetical protein